MNAERSNFGGKRNAYSLLMGLVCLVLGGLGASVFIVGPEAVPVAEAGTVWRFEILTVYVGLIVSLIGYRYLTNEQDKITRIEKLSEIGARKDWTGRLIVSFAIAWIVGVACLAVFLAAINPQFPDAELPRIVMMLLFAVYAALLGYGVAFFVVAMDEVELKVVVVALFCAVLFSITLVRNSAWVQRSVSALGIDGGSGTLFNISVIVIGLVALILVRDLIANLKFLSDLNLFPGSGYQWIRFGLTAIALGIVGVGLFPTEGLPLSHEMHLLCAYTMTILSILGMLTLSVIAPGIYPRAFVYVSAGLGVVCIVTIAANLLGSMPFVTMEWILFGIFGLWLGLFNYFTIRYVRAQAAKASAEARAAQAAAAGG